ncbi:hypothetical protein BZG36_01244 [Bifiguratus adelaidae]|uniref:BLOC-1-related complex subunit 6 C-terminal helix domain-containing protein n=1 Tax=Bifiguratus adelaidae TaxID=1938954 RepID=A0A261Y5U8_9FUNG|nr:hypothetical protein BZG36_01244 [Bifiguratus adelaidae]
MSISNTVPINPKLLDDLEKHATTLQHALDDLLVTLQSQLSEADYCVTDTLSLQQRTIHTLNTSVQTAIDDTTDLIHACESLASDLDARLPPLATHIRELYKMIGR